MYACTRACARGLKDFQRSGYTPFECIGDQECSPPKLGEQDRRKQWEARKTGSNSG
nr:MAG TPA: hypothetical protein [Caudoviricetes sp.]